VSRSSLSLATQRANVGMLKVWNGNEGPTLQQLVDACRLEVAWKR